MYFICSNWSITFSPENKLIFCLSFPLFFVCLSVRPSVSFISLSPSLSVICPPRLSFSCRVFIFLYCLSLSLLLFSLPLSLSSSPLLSVSISSSPLPSVSLLFLSQAYIFSPLFFFFSSLSFAHCLPLISLSLSLLFFVISLAHYLSRSLSSFLSISLLSLPSRTHSDFILPL